MTKAMLVMSFLAACGSANTGTPGDDDTAFIDGGDAGSGSSANAAKCTPGPQHLTKGQSVTFSSTPGGTGNRQRDYCFELPDGTTNLQLQMKGGSCTTGACSGDDVHAFIKKGDVPDAFQPDDSTKEWTYTPGPSGLGTHAQSGSPGAWYLSLRDDANTLGYSNVSLVLQ